MTGAGRPSLPGTSGTTFGPKRPPLPRRRAAGARAGARIGPDVLSVGGSGAIFTGGAARSFHHPPLARTRAGPATPPLHSLCGRRSPAAKGDHSATGQPNAIGSLRSPGQSHLDGTCRQRRPKPSARRRKRPSNRLGGGPRAAGDRLDRLHRDIPLFAECAYRVEVLAVTFLSAATPNTATVLRPVPETLREQSKALRRRLVA